jgi:hypothetical protein
VALRETLGEREVDAVVVEDPDQGAGEVGGDDGRDGEARGRRPRRAA